jgi:8-oxo-dGTP pyrophosphatase MutT (NUDIX family)
MDAPDLARVRAALAAHEPARVPDAVSSRAAVAVILRNGADGLELLFIRRAEDPRDPWSGQMAFPGGRAEPGDPELRFTAMRETAEEIGLDLAREAEFLGSLDEVRAMARLRPMDLSITPFVFHLAGDAPMTIGEEVTSIHWLPLAELLGIEARSSYEYHHAGGVLTFPALRLEGVVIWGLTYKMLGSLTGLLVRPQAEGAPAWPS